MEQLTYKAIRDEGIKKIAHLLSEREYKMLVDGVVKGFAAFIDDVAAACLLYRTYDKEIAVLEYLYVDENARRRKLGRKMMDIFCEYLKASKLDMMFEFEAKNNEIVSFVKAAGDFYIEKNDDFDALISAEETAEICKKFALKELKANLYFEQPKAMQNKFADELEKTYPMIAWQLKNDQNVFEKDLCCCSVDKDGIQAVCLVKETEGVRELSFLYARAGKGVLAAKALTDMIGAAAGKEVMPLKMSIMNETSEKILKQMSKNYEVSNNRYTAYYFAD